MAMTIEITKLVPESVSQKWARLRYQVYGWIRGADVRHRDQKLSVLNVESVIYNTITSENGHLSAIQNMVLSTGFGSPL